MATTTATVTSDGISLPAEFMKGLELKPGSQVEVTTAQQPGEATLLLLSDKPRKTRAEVEDVVKSLRRKFAGGPSLEDEYLRDKEKDKW